MFCRPLTPSSFCSFVLLIWAGAQTRPPCHQPPHSTTPTSHPQLTRPSPPFSLPPTGRRIVLQAFPLPTLAFRHLPPYLKDHEDCLLHGSAAARRRPGQGRPKSLGNQTAKDQMLPRGERCPAVCLSLVPSVFVACHVSASASVVCLTHASAFRPPSPACVACACVSVCVRARVCLCCLPPYSSLSIPPSPPP